MQTKTIHLDDDIEITVHRLTYGQQLELNAMFRKFMPSVDPKHSLDDADQRTARANFCVFGAQTSDTKGIAVSLPELGDDVATFEAKLEGFFALDNGVIDCWLDAINDLSKPLVPRVQLPDEHLTEEERKNPSSERRGGKSKPTSARASATALPSS